MTPTPKPFHTKKLGQSCAHSNYGLTCNQYNSMIDECNATCPICGRSSPEVALVIDHDHAVGAWAVRGILCAHCNAWLESPITAGPARDAYLARPWYARNPGHPVIPTPKQPTTAAQCLYRELDDLAAELSNTAGRKHPGNPVWVRAGDVGVALLREGEKPTRIVARAPFSMPHLRKLARAHGIGPAVLCGAASEKMRARYSL